ncbi:MAG: hypothetical protein WA213_20975 [Terriglobales bacterium]
MNRPLDYETRVGRPDDLERDAWGDRFGLTTRQTRNLTNAFMAQLCRCKSDAARCVLLGVTR